ncbi:GNAT family N-acetyltransferase [Lentzea tibetensis]|uniref:GNAT family N-acetyltransferase n=1 Tax=Lentzea tibetensis TaxID=2591470 RepID=A0A563EL70_9PSEU|nr:GNAT family N-acetyltransferase [Lentzea tibetensis]TWP47907.1 GNAT family N-acetyltransferase [Lentzea tibetensis]
MEAVAHDDVTEFAAVVSGFLEATPAPHSVHLSTMDMVVRGTMQATLISLHDNGNVVGVVTRLRPVRPLQIAAMPPAAAPVVAELLRSVDPALTSVVGPRDRVEAFRAAWQEGGFETVPTFFYRLGSLVAPDLPGVARIVEPESLLSWWYEFLRDTTELSPDAAEAFVRMSLTMPATHVVWELDGERVAWAATTTPVGGVSRIGPVYTPPEHRGHGYAAAATAAIARWALAEGAREVVLMTDADDPVPNKLYRRLGFELIGDWSYWSFTQPGS